MESQSDINYYNNFDGKIAVKRGVVLTSHKIQVRFLLVPCYMYQTEIWEKHAWHGII